MVAEEILTFLKTHKSEIEQDFHASKLGLFGSFARNEASEESDIDILYDLNESATEFVDLKKKFRQYLQDNLHRSVDLCRIKYMKSFVKEIVEKEALYV